MNEIPIKVQNERKESTLVSISPTKLLDMAFEAATCFVPTEKLTGEQLDRFDNIQYRLCRSNCPICKELRVRDNLPSVLGHAQGLTCHIGITHDLMNELGNVHGKFKMAVPIFLLELISTCLHEIIHIVFPEYSEAEVRNKTVEWLTSYQWKDKM